MAKAQQRGSTQLAVLALIVGAIGVAVGGIGLYMALDNQSRLVPGEGMSGYDFSSPEKALMAYQQIDLEMDALAQLQLQKLRSKENRDEEKKRLDSTKVDKSEEYSGYHLVYYKYERDDKDRYATAWFKEVEGKFLRVGNPLVLERDDFKIDAKKKAELSKAISDWRRKDMPAIPQPRLRRP